MDVKYLMKERWRITPKEEKMKFFSRIRVDNSKENSLNLWCIYNIRAALNAVEIAESYLKIKMKIKSISPHIQNSWHISSLVSISHRITGVINIYLISIICLWVAFYFFIESNYEVVQNFLKSFFGKVVIIGALWSFNFKF